MGDSVSVLDVEMVKAKKVIMLELIKAFLSIF